MPRLRKPTIRCAALRASPLRRSSETGSCCRQAIRTHPAAPPRLRPATPLAHAAPSCAHPQHVVSLHRVEVDAHVATTAAALRAGSTFGSRLRRRLGPSCPGPARKTAAGIGPMMLKPPFGAANPPIRTGPTMPVQLANAIAFEKEILAANRFRTPNCNNCVIVYPLLCALLRQDAQEQGVRLAAGQQSRSAGLYVALR